MNTNFGKLKLAAVLSVALMVGAGARAQDAPAPNRATPPPVIAPDSAAPNATPVPPADAKPAPMADKTKMDAMNSMGGSLINLPAPVLENGVGLSRYQKTLIEDIRHRHNDAKGGTMAPSDWAILGSYAGDMGANGGSVSPDAQADWEIRSILTPEQRQQAGDGIGAVMVLEKYGIPAPLAGKLDLSLEQKRTFAEWGMKKWGDKGFGEWAPKDAPKTPEAGMDPGKIQVRALEGSQKESLLFPKPPSNDMYDPKSGEYSLTFFEDNAFKPFLQEAGIKGDQAIVLSKLTPIQRRMVADFWWNDQNKEMRQMAMTDMNRM